MASIRRVAVTGLGMISGLGHTVSANWNALIAGQSGVSSIESIPCSHLPVRIAGEIKHFQLSDSILSAKDASRYDRFIHYALHATHEAMTMSGLYPTRPYGRERMGCILGVGMGGLPSIESTLKNYVEKGPRQVSPFFIPSVLPNMTSGFISIHFGLTGSNYTISSACASSSHAISAAANEIMLGRQDVMVTGGAESVLCDLAILGFANMRALSKRNDEPTRASRPFDRDRDGFVMGEGAGILILEDMEKALERGAPIISEIIGHGSTADAEHITAPHPDGEGAIACMRMALESARIHASEVDYINAHGTSTHLGDIAETRAIKKVFGDHAIRVNVSSTKSMTGHLLGAAGGLESIISALSTFHDVIPPTINLDTPDAECDLNYTPHQSVRRTVNVAMTNSFGFGGTNSSILFKKI